MNSNEKYYLVILTDSVYADLLEMLEHYSEQRQLNILKEVDRLIKNLSTFPLLGRTIDYSDGKEIHKFYIKPYNIFYTINYNNRTVTIHMIKHYRNWYRTNY